MKRAIAVLCVFFIAASLLIFWVGCGGGGTTGVQPPPPPPVITVTIAPTSATLNQGQTQQFTATVTGTSNTKVNWTATGGTVDGNGLYTAGNVAGSTFSVTAAAQADITKSASASVTVESIVVTIAPTSATLNQGQTQQFTATVTGTSNTKVNWTATGGTVDGNGLYTAGNVAGNTFSVTAAAQADATKLASASVTINALPPAVITAMTSFVAWRNIYGLSNKYVITGKNFMNTDKILLGRALSGGSMATFVSSTEIDLTAQWDTPTYDPGQNSVTISRADGSASSNTFVFGMLTNRNSLVRDSSTGDIFQYEAGAYKVYHFTSSGILLGSFTAGIWGMALDDITKQLVFTQTNGGAIFGRYAEDGTPEGGDGSGAMATDVDASGGIACAVQPTGNTVICLNITTRAVATSSAVFSDPGSIKMGLVGAELDAFMFSCGNNQLARMNTSTMAVVGNPLQLTGITTTPSTATSVRVVYFPATKTVAVVSPADNTVVLADATSMTVQRTVALTGTTYAGFADQVNGKLVVIYNPNTVGMAGTQATPVNLLAVDVVTGNTAALTAPPADILPTGGAVSLDGKTVILGERNRVTLSANQ